jgi:hypothetical protein
MPRFNFKTDDLVGEFLPDIVFRRITIEDYLQDDTVHGGSKVFNRIEGKVHLEIDLEIKDVMDKEVQKITAAAVKEGLTREVPGVGRPERSGEELIDSALKVCVLIALDGRSDEAIKRLLIRRGGQRANFRDRFNESVLNRLTNTEIMNPSIGDAMRHIGRISGQEDADIEVGSVAYMEAPARTLNGEQYTAATYELTATRDSDNKVVYRLPHTFKKILSGRDWVSVFAFTFMDFSIFDLPLDGEELAFLNNLYGKLSYIKVLSGGKVTPTSMVLLDNNGAVYNGPYHQMGVHGAYMKGRFHNSNLTSPNQYLTPLMVPNYKVQDFRSFSRAEADSYLPADIPSFLQNDLVAKLVEKKRSEKINARLDLNHDPSTGVVSMEVIIDQEQILRNYSKFSSLYKGLGNQARWYMLQPRDSFRLVKASIIRRRVTKRDIGISRLGFGAKDEFDREEPYHIVAETGEAHMAGPEPDYTLSQEDLLIPVLTTQAELSDDTLENIINSFDYRGMLDFLRGRVNNPPIENDRPLPFPFYRNIIIKDKSLVNITDGVYQYGIELVYEDPIETLLKENLMLLRESTKDLQEYYNEGSIPVFSAKFAMSISHEEIDPETGRPYTVVTGRIPAKRGNYNSIRKAFTPEFVSYANEKYDFDQIARTYKNVFQLIMADASARVNNIPEVFRYQRHEDSADIITSDIIARLIKPNNSRPEQILSVLNSMIELEGLLEDMLDIDLIKDAGNVQLTPAQAGSSGRAPSLMRVQRWFSQPGNYVDARHREDVEMKFMLDEPERSMVAGPEFQEEEADQPSPLAVARRKALEFLRTVLRESKNPAVIATIRKFERDVLNDERIDDPRVIEQLMNEFRLVLAEMEAK